MNILCKRNMNSTLHGEIRIFKKVYLRYPCLITDIFRPAIILGLLSCVTRA